MALRRTSDAVLILLFALALGLPAAWFVLGRAQPKMLAGENRPPAPRPTFSMERKVLNRFPAKFEAYIQDRIPARELMLSEQARIKVDWLDSSSSEKVIVGRDGWLFMDEEKSENPGREVSQQEQCRLWAQEFRRRHDWLTQRGIRYIIVLIPEKHSIYREFLPEVHGHAHGPTAAELLTEVLRGDPNMNVVELREAMLARKGERQLYFHTDTHWNDEGAYIGYRALVERLASCFPQIRRLERDDFDRGLVMTFTGDLSRILHLPGNRTEPFESWRLRQPHAVRLPEALPLNSRLHFPKHLPPQIWGRQDPHLPRAVLFHDSFAAQMWLPVLAEHFDRLGYAATAGFDPETVEAVQPQVVIQEIVERKINWHVPQPLPR